MSDNSTAERQIYFDSEGKPQYMPHHLRHVWREAYNAALTSGSAWAFANAALTDYLERWPL